VWFAGAPTPAHWQSLALMSLRGSQGPLPLLTGSRWRWCRYLVRRGPYPCSLAVVDVGIVTWFRRGPKPCSLAVVDVGIVTWFAGAPPLLTGSSSTRLVIVPGQRRADQAYSRLQQDHASFANQAGQRESALARQVQLLRDALRRESGSR
jgi:hypothetical protein